MESLRSQLRGDAPFVIPVVPSTAHHAPTVAHPESTIAQPTPVVVQPAPSVAPPAPSVAPPAGDIAAIPSVVHGSPRTEYEEGPSTIVYEPPLSPTRTVPPPGLHPGHPAQQMEVAYSGPSDVELADNERERQERFEELAEGMQNTIVDLQESEEKREQNYRANEDERERLFMENERRRDEEAILRRDGVWKELEDRLAALPPVGEPPMLAPPAPETMQMPEPEVPAADIPQTLSPAAPMDSDAVSIVETVQRAASLHAEEIREIVRAEREELQREREAAQAERERAQAEEAAEKARMHEEYQAHIRSLEAELEAVRKELEDEKMARATDEAERRERERAEMLEHNDLMRNQLGDLTNLVTEQRDELVRKREVADERWEVKQNRWEQKDAEDAQTRNMLQTILENQAQMLAEQVQCKNELQEELRQSQYIHDTDVCLTLISHV